MLTAPTIAQEGILTNAPPGNQLLESAGVLLITHRHHNVASVIRDALRSTRYRGCLARTSDRPVVIRLGHDFARKANGGDKAIIIAQTRSAAAYLTVPAIAEQTRSFHSGTAPHGSPLIASKPGNTLYS